MAGSVCTAVSKLHTITLSLDVTCEKERERERRKKRYQTVLTTAFAINLPDVPFSHIHYAKATCTDG